MLALIFHHQRVDPTSEHNALHDNYKMLKQGKDSIVDVPSVLLFVHYEVNLAKTILMILMTRVSQNIMQHCG
jgi:hypothetical protein